MGFKPSPYKAGQGMLMAEDFIRGDPLDLNNIFHYDCVVLNHPGLPSYTPSKPWVYKLRSIDGNIANDFFIYVDDVRSSGFSVDNCWKCTWLVASKNYLSL
jgi:hypothetical protein